MSLVAKAFVLFGGIFSLAAAYFGISAHRMGRGQAEVADMTEVSIMLGASQVVFWQLALSASIVSALFFVGAGIVDALHRRDP